MRRKKQIETREGEGKQTQLHWWNYGQTNSKTRKKRKKRVRQEDKDMIRDIFKKSKKIIRTSPKLGEDEKKKNRKSREKKEK